MLSPDSIILAPKPIRLSSSSNPFARQRPSRLVSAPTDAFSRIKLSDDRDTESSNNAESPQPQPEQDDGEQNRPYTLAPEALEEFLAILRPALRSPSSRTRRHHHSSSSTTLPTFRSSSSAGFTSPASYERPHPYKRDSVPKTRSEPSSVSSHSSDTADPTSVTERDNRKKKKTSINGDVSVIDPLADQWHNNSALLASPISRSQTRNPLPRHPSYETLSSNLVFHFQRSPEPLLLPRRTPDQMLFSYHTPESPLALVINNVDDAQPSPTAPLITHDVTLDGMDTC